jgi:hypothetical protein
MRATQVRGRRGLDSRATKKFCQNPKIECKEFQSSPSVIGRATSSDWNVWTIRASNIWLALCAYSLRSTQHDNSSLKVSRCVG